MALHKYWSLQHQTFHLPRRMSHFLLQLFFLKNIQGLLCSSYCLFLLLGDNHGVLLDDLQQKLVVVGSFRHCYIWPFVSNIHSKVFISLQFWTSDWKASPRLVITCLEDLSSEKLHTIQGMLLSYICLGDKCYQLDSFTLGI